MTLYFQEEFCPRAAEPSVINLCSQIFHECKELYYEGSKFCFPIYDPRRGLPIVHRWLDSVGIFGRRHIKHIFLQIRTAGIRYQDIVAINSRLSEEATVRYWFSDLYLLSDIWDMAKSFEESNAGKAPMLEARRHHPGDEPPLTTIIYTSMARVACPIESDVLSMKLIFFPNEGWFSKHE